MAQALVRSKTDSFENLLKNINFDFQQNIEICVTPTTLKDIALAKIATCIWQREGSFNELKRFVYSNEFRECIFAAQKHFIYDFADSGEEESDDEDDLRVVYGTTIYEFEKKVVGKLSSLVLPTPCKDALEKMIKVVGKQLQNYFHSQAQADYGVPWNDAKIHWDNLVWTQQGTINYYKTAIQIIDNTDLSVKDKYFIACNTCIEVKIRDLLKKLPKSCIDDFEKDDSDGKPYHMTLFWTFYIRDELERFSEFSNEESHAIYLINWSIGHRLGFAAFYFWENFADTNLKNHLLDFVSQCKIFLGNENIVLFFLKQANSVELQALSLKATNYLLDLVSNEVLRWHKLFAPFAIYILQLFRKMDIRVALEIVLVCWRENFLNLKEYQNIWKEFALHFQLNIENNLKNLYSQFFCYRLKINDTTTTKIVLKIGTVSIKKRLLLCCKGIDICLSFLSKGRLDFFDEFLKEILQNEKEITNFKEGFFPQIREKLCFKLIGCENYSLLNRILNKFYGTKKITKFKSRLPYQDNSIIICKILKSDVLRVSDQLERLERFLSWCFEGNTKDIVKCMANIFDLKKMARHINLFFKQIEILLEKKKFELLRKYWRWIFFADGRNCRSRDDKMYLIKKILFLSAADRGCVLFKQFLSCCFNQEEIEELRLMEGSEDLKLIVKSLLELDKYTDVDELLNFCCTSDKEKMAEFKMEFMHTMGCVLIDKWVFSEENDELKIKKLFKWFNPTVESAKLLKEKFNTFIKTKLATKVESYMWHEPICFHEELLQRLKKRVDEILNSLILSVEHNFKTDVENGQNRIPLDKENQTKNKLSVTRRSKDASSILSARENTQMTSALASDQTQNTSLRLSPLHARRQIKAQTLPLRASKRINTKAPTSHASKGLNAQSLSTRASKRLNAQVSSTRASKRLNAQATSRASK